MTIPEILEKSINPTFLSRDENEYLQNKLVPALLALTNIANRQVIATKVLRI